MNIKEVLINKNIDRFHVNIFSDKSSIKALIKKKNEPRIKKGKIVEKKE